MEKDKVNIWGLNVYPVSMERFMKIIDSKYKKEKIHITGVNPETIALAINNEKMFDAIRSSDMVNIDNNFLMIILRLLKYNIKQRIATPDLFENLLMYANNNEQTVYLLGSEKDVLKKAVINIKKQYPKIRSIYYHDGYYKADEEVGIISEIKSKKPDMLFVALPSPKKEIFIKENKKDLNIPLMLGVGGAIDVKAGVVKRGSRTIQKIGLEGIYRSLQNPINYGKRYFMYYPEFVKYVIKNRDK